MMSGTELGRQEVITKRDLRSCGQGAQTNAKSRALLALTAAPSRIKVPLTPKNEARVALLDCIGEPIVV